MIVAHFIVAKMAMFSSSNVTRQTRLVLTNCVGTFRK
jgi:hypothetical protein